MVQHRKQVCPVFATTAIDSATTDTLPENAVPGLLSQGATHMPETNNVKTTMRGPASRMHMFSRQGPDADNGTDDESNNSGDGPTPAETPGQNATTPGDPGSAGGVPPPAGAPAVLNEHETIVGVDEESLPQTARMFEALKTNLETPSAEGAKLAQSRVGQQSEDEVAEVAAQTQPLKSSSAPPPQ